MPLTSASIVLLATIGVVLLPPSEPTPTVGILARDAADCLWLAARDHGFYGVQSDAIAVDADAATVALWRDFLDSAGRERCTVTAPLRPDRVRAALRASRHAADRHFLGAP